MKKKYSLILIILFSGFFFKSAFAQQDSQFSQYMFNTLFFNPAYAGSEGFSRFQLHYRNQWTGYSTSNSSDNLGAITTTNFSFTTPISRLRSGVGVYVNQDKNSPITNLDAQISYAYHYPLKNGKLSIGLRGGMYNNVTDFDKYRAVEPNDQLISTGRQTATKPDLAAGLYYRTEKYYMGISINHIVHSKFSYDKVSLINALATHAYFTAGYNLDINYEWVFTPSVLIKSDINTYQFSLSGLLTYNRNFWGGLSFNQGDAAILMVGANFGKDKQGNRPFRFGYSFDFIIKGYQAKARTSSELILSYRLPNFIPTARTITRTPRFRQH